MSKALTKKEIGGETPTNGASNAIESGIPYVISVTLIGTADMLFHRWNCEAVDEKAKAAKGSTAKKTDNIESYVYRDDDGFICLPGEYLRQAIIAAAKFRQDPRSPRKSAMDLYKAGVVSLTPLSQIYSSISQGKLRSGPASSGTERIGMVQAGSGIGSPRLGKAPASEWDYEDRRRVVVQRAGVNRTRPAMKAGWSATFDLMVNLPEYISPTDLNDVVAAAGRLVGVGDFRPTYGRFQIMHFALQSDDVREVAE